METIVYSDLNLKGALVMSKNETGFPSNPSLGTMIIKDQCLYAYIRVGGMETWFPFSRATTSYIHTQGLASTTWTVNHNLGTTNIWYQVKDANGNIMIVGKTDVNENTFLLDFTEAVTGTCIVVAPDTIDVPQIKASVLSVANDAVVIDSSGVKINGSYALTAANIAQQIADAIATKDNSDEITEGTTNLYFTNTRARAAISVSDLGGDGSLSYDNVTGVITYTGPSATEVRAHFSQGTGITITNGQIAVDNTIATVTALNSEITRATAAESTLTANLNAEITRATNAESTIAANVLVEKTRAQNAEATLTANLNTEITRASAAEATLTANLNAEITRATAAEVTLTSNLTTEITNRTNAISTLTANLNAEITRSTNADASLAAAIAAIGSAFNYVGTVSGGASSGAAYDMNTLATGGKDVGDYYKVIVAGYFKVGTGGTPFYANIGDGLVWNNAAGIDKIDNSDTVVLGTANEISVTGSVDAGFTVGLHSAFSGRMSTVESGLTAETSRAMAAEAALATAVAAAGSAIIGLNDLSDVTLTSSTYPNVLLYNGFYWENNSLRLDQLGDVTNPERATGDVLTWDAVTSKWGVSTPGTLIVDDNTTDAAFYPMLSPVSYGSPITSANVASTELSFNPSSGTLSSTVFSGTSVVMSDGAVSTATLTTSTTSANQVVSTFATTLFRTAKFVIQVVSGTAYQASEILAIHDGTTVTFTETNQLNVGSSLGTFDMDISTGNVRLLFSPVNAATTVKVIRTGINI